MVFVIQNNVMVFIAELFWWFENVKPDFVHPRDLQDVKDGKIFFLHYRFVLAYVTKLIYLKARQSIIFYFCCQS